MYADHISKQGGGTDPTGLVRATPRPLVPSIRACCGLNDAFWQRMFVLGIPVRALIARVYGPGRHDSICNQSHFGGVDDPMCYKVILVVLMTLCATKSFWWC
mmetsp:Transcript_90156/g.156108  ORF Transcript_90156/g.156108 Transcript_90156/m.156108 type:complete len:102 (+) Transcript_90156:411-716(+)